MNQYFDESLTIVRQSGEILYQHNYSISYSIIDVKLMGIDIKNGVKRTD